MSYLYTKGKFTLKSGEILSVEYREGYTPAVYSLPEYSSPAEYGDIEDIEVTLDGEYLDPDNVPTRYRNLVEQFINGDHKGWEVDNEYCEPDYDYW